MNFKEFLIESELLTEMATCYTDGSTHIGVNPVDSGNHCYFKYYNGRDYNSSTACARISLLGPEYFYNHDDDFNTLVLSSTARKKLVKKLNSQSIKYKRYNITVFQSIIVDYNIEKFGVYIDETFEIKEYQFGKPLPINLPQPNYKKLPSEDEVKKNSKKRVESL